MSTIPRIYTKELNEIKEEIRKIKKSKWYQKWWGILFLGIIASGIIALIFYLL